WYPCAPPRGKARFAPFRSRPMFQKSAAQHLPADLSMPASGAVSSAFDPTAQAALWRVDGMALPGQGAAEDDDVRALRQIGTAFRIGPGVTVFNAGDTAEFSYEMISGAARLCRHLADGRRQIAQFLLPGDFFSAMDAKEHSFTAETITDVALLRYPKNQ